jgi:ABC-type dipeptide/oligopeptide/nickel transport system ATPase component
MTKVINLFGGSGIGKSTTAAHTFAEMKYRKMHCELVREYVKMWAWQNVKPGEFDQIYLLGKQAKYESMLYGKVDYIITDSPLLLSPIYEIYHAGKQTIGMAAKNFIEYAKTKDVEHVNFVLRRNKDFDPRGRYDSAEEAKIVDNIVVNYLKENNIPYYEVDCDDRDRAEFIINKILN